MMGVDKLGQVAIKGADCHPQQGEIVLIGQCCGNAEAAAHWIWMMDFIADGESLKARRARRIEVANQPCSVQSASSNGPTSSTRTEVRQDRSIQQYLVQEL